MSVVGSWYTPWICEDNGECIPRAIRLRPMPLDTSDLAYLTSVNLIRIGCDHVYRDPTLFDAKYSSSVRV